MNAYRDEVALELCGQRYIMRPTFAALAEMEGRCGFGLIQLAGLIAERQVRLSHLVAIIDAGIKGAGGKSPENLGDLILKTGMVTVISHIGKWMESIFIGDADVLANQREQATGKE